MTRTAAELRRPGDWAGIEVAEGGSAQLEHVVVSYAQDGVSAGSAVAAFSLTNSMVSESSGTGVYLDLEPSSAAPAVTGDTADDSGGPAMQVAGSRLRLRR